MSNSAAKVAGAVAQAFWLVSHWKIVVVGIVISTVAFFSLLVVAAAQQDSSSAAPQSDPCLADGIDPPVVVEAPADVQSEQIKNARIIDQVAAKLGLSGKASRIAIITAMGESSLINIDYGDVAGPDSKGLFQQRTTMGWGTVEQVMNPEFAASSFFTGRTTNKGLIDVAGWERMEPTVAIHKVQNNADPHHYTRFYSAADAVIAKAEIDVNRQGDEHPEDSDAELANSDTGNQCGSGGNGGNSPDGDGNDDYPWKHLTPPSGEYVADPMGFFYGECTSWVSWVINRNAGSTEAPFKYSYDKGNFVNGNAKEWKQAWLNRGWKISRTPVAGAVAWWDAGSGGAGWAGHVAIVHEVMPDGRVVIEEYNGTPPGGREYGIRAPQAPETVDMYLYPPE